MNIFELTRTLVDIESISGNEARVGAYLADHLAPMAARFGGSVERMEVERDRFNVFAQWGEPVVTFSTHIDTVPPFFASRDDGENLWGRGSCDTKGIIASMIFAIEELLGDGVRNVGLLLVVGEERNSTGARHASNHSRGAKFLINGEPTENKLAIGSKGAMRLELTAHGRMAHSAYPELGESAIEKLLDALTEIRKMPLPVDSLLGPSTLNIGLIGGGRAANVIPDHAQAEIMIRLVDDGASTREGLQRAARERAVIHEVLAIPALHLGTIDGLETTVVSFTTDIPVFAGAWGSPYLIGPGTIHVAHTDKEHVPKQQLIDAVQIYKRMARQLLQ